MEEGPKTLFLGPSFLRGIGSIARGEKELTEMYR